MMPQSIILLVILGLFAQVMATTTYAVADGATATVNPGTWSGTSTAASSTSSTDTVGCSSVQLDPDTLVETSNNTGSISSTFIVEVDQNGLSISVAIGAVTIITGKSMTLVNGQECLCAGKLVQFQNTSQSISWGSIPLINCDNEIQAGELLASLNSGDNPCTLLYSGLSQGCNIPTDNCNAVETSLGSVFTVLTMSAGQSLLSLTSNASTPVTGYIKPTVSSLTSSNVASHSSGNSLAMGILYAATGIVAGAFLFIIISGAIRVHKHPERYGLLPHNYGDNNGGFGSSNNGNAVRAKGLARAVLDSIPLVRVQVGVTDDAPQKDEEKGNGELRIEDPNGDHIKALELDGHPLNTDGDPNVTQKPINISSFIGPEEDDLCPICFEELQDGDILRVLPCKHKFHALCVDAWLLNSSSLCPLCRVDLSIADNEDIPETPPRESESSTSRRQSNVIIPPGYDLTTSRFNRFLDVWNAQFLPREAKRAALQRFHEEAEIRRSLRANNDQQYAEQDRNRWTQFVNSRRWLFNRRKTHETPEHEPETQIEHAEPGSNVDETQT